MSDRGPLRRFGSYVSQPHGYRAFFPAPLPPDPPLDLGGDLPRLLSDADRALGRHDGSVLTLPNPDLFVFMYVRKEAALSSQIEGTQSSLQDLLTAEARVLDPERPHDVVEVVSYVRAMDHGLRRLAELPVRSTGTSPGAAPSAHGRFASVFDSGFLHLLDDEASDRWARDLAVALEVGGRSYLHEFAIEFPVPNVPRAVTESEVRQRFGVGWNVLHVGPAEFVNTVAAPTPAIVARIERV